MEFQSFPQPTRPTSFSKLTSFKYSATVSEPISLQDSEPSTSAASRLQQPDEYKDEVFDELTRILFECLESVDNENKGSLLRKIFFQLEKDSQMENIILEKLKNTQVKAISELLEKYTGSLISQNGEYEEKYDQQETVSRGINGSLTEAVGTGESILEFKRKLERFKVKTLNIEGGVIKK